MLAYVIPPETPGGTPTCVRAGIVELCSPHTIDAANFRAEHQAIAGERWRQ